MIFIFFGLLLLIAVSAFALQFFMRMRTLRAVGVHSANQNVTGRYHPMLRLLSEKDLGILADNPQLLKTVRNQRRRIFRAYLKCLTKDYAQLLAGLRLAMVTSSVDRPDLAKALARNRMLFALAICKVEYRLALNALGLGTVDISGVVAAFDTMRGHVTRFQQATPVAAA
jgi:hypothetical protein